MRSRRTCLLGLMALAGLLTLTTGGCGGVEDAEAAKLFDASLGDMTVTVFPAYVRDSDPHYDATESAKIADFLQSEGYADCTLSDVDVPIAGDWGMDESKMYRNSLKSFQNYLAAHPVDTDYALLPEYLMGRDAVGGVHIYVVARDGRVPFGTGVNSHFAEFKEVDPKTVADATEVAIRRMRNEFKERASAQAKSDLDQNTALTIYPVVMFGGPRKDVADVIGLMLEREGMTSHVTTEAKYTPPDGCALTEFSTGFASFVRQNPPQTEYALCVQFCGTPQSGPDRDPQRAGDAHGHRAVDRRADARGRGFQTHQAEGSDDVLRARDRPAQAEVRPRRAVRGPSRPATASSSSGRRARTHRARRSLLR